MRYIGNQALNGTDGAETQEWHVDISVSIKPKDARTKVLYNVPIGTERMFRVSVLPRIGRDFAVDIAQPQASWIRLRKESGKVPFTTSVEINTYGLEPASIYMEDLVFAVNGVDIHREPVMLSTQFYDPANLPDVPLYTPLNPGKRKKYLFLSMISAINTVTQFAIAAVVLIVALFILLFVLLIFSAVIAA